MIVSAYKEINSQSNAAKCTEIIRENSIDLLFVVVCGDQSARADFTRGISPIKIVKLPPEWRSQDANSWSCSWFTVVVAWNLRENRFIIIFIPSIARLAAQNIFQASSSYSLMLECRARSHRLALKVIFISWMKTFHSFNKKATQNTWIYGF